MLSIEIGGKNYYLPQNYSDITLGQYAKSDTLMKRMPKDISEYINGKREDINLETLENTAFICDYVSYYLGCPTEQLQKANLFIDEGSEDLGLINLFNLLGFTFGTPEIPETEILSYGFHKYYLDVERIEHLNKVILYNSTNVSDFIEAQLLKTATLQKDGVGVGNLPTLVALLYRRKSRKWLLSKAKFETLTYDKIKERAKHFEDMPCDIALGALFFFCKVEANLVKRFPVIFKGDGKKGSGRLDKYGWYSVVKQVAKEKIFDLPGLNSIDSIKRTRVVDFLKYLEVEKIEFQELEIEREKSKKRK